MRRTTIVWLPVAALCLLAPWLPGPPAPEPAQAPPETFSAARAFAHVEELAREPRPPGSAAHARVRAWLVAHLRALGFEVEVQEAVAVQGRFAQPDAGLAPAAAVIRNVVAVRRGTASAGAVLLVAHYDSKATTPGAADDAMGVAVLLETARALTATPLRNDLVLLLSDGEELGLVGAHVFAREHPLVREVGVFLNFEARGDAGPVMMFRTTPGSAPLVDALARAVSHPVTTSLMAAVARRLPNDTDFTELAAVGLRGLDFANVGGFARYHAPTDTPENLDRRTLQHHGSYALGLARHLGALPSFEPLADAADASWFTPLPGRVVRYPESWDRAAALAGLVLSILLISLGIRAGARPGGIVAGALFAVVAPVTAGLAVLAAHRALLVASPDFALAPSLSPEAVEAWQWAFLFAAATTTTGLYALARRFGDPRAIAAGAGLGWAGLAVATAFLVPGAGYLLCWPALGLALAAASRSPSGELATLAGLAAGLVTIVLWRPILPLLAETFALANPLVVPALTALVLTGVPAALEALSGPRGRVTLGLLAATGLLAGAAATVPPFTASHPRPDVLFHAQELESGRAFLVSPDARTDDWTETMVDAEPVTAPWLLPARPDQPLRLRAVPPVEVPGSKVEPFAGPAPAGPRRVVRALVRPAPGSLMTALSIPAGAGITAARAGGRPVPPWRDGLLLNWFGDDAFELELEAGEAPLRLQLTTRRDGFPPGTAPAPRPAGHMAKPSRVLPPRDELQDSDGHLAVQRFVL